MLYRKIQSYIENHLRSGSNKILVIDGARQIGKTYIIKYTAEKLFKNYIEINMLEDSLKDRYFSNVRTVDDFYLQVSMIAGEKMENKDNTIIFIDEIQAYPHLLTAAKLSLGMCWKAGIAAEIIGQPRNSIGAQLNQAKLFFNTPELFAWTIAIIVVSVAFERLVMVGIHALMRRTGHA